MLLISHLVGLPPEIAGSFGSTPVVRTRLVCEWNVCRYLHYQARLGIDMRWHIGKERMADFESARHLEIESLRLVSSSVTERLCTLTGGTFE